jgi:hypothetical protein
LKGYGKLLRGVVYIAMWVAALGALSAVITLPLWFAASRFPTAYTAVALAIVLTGVSWLLLGGQRPTGRTVLWTVIILIALLSLALGWYVPMVVTFVVATGMVAYRIA